MARERREIACQEFAEVCRRIETDLHYQSQSTSPVRLQVVHCVGTIKVYRDGILWQVIDTQEGLDRWASPYGNR